MSLAAETREAVRNEPFLLEALRAGVVNYAAAARYLGVSDDTEAVSAALRRFEGSLPARETDARDVRVTMHRGMEPMAGSEGGLITVGEHGFALGEGSHTGLLARGEVDTRGLAHALDRLHTNGIEAVAAGVAGQGLLIVVREADGAAALRRLEDSLAAVPG